MTNSPVGESGWRGSIGITRSPDSGGGKGSAMTRGSRASQSDTVSLRAVAGAGREVAAQSTSRARPASADRRFPRRRKPETTMRVFFAQGFLAHAGAKSTTISRPPGASARAASRMARPGSSR